MNDTVTLQHERLKGNRVVPFYDGLLVAQDGLLTIPANRPSWIKRAFWTGWNKTPQGVRIFGLNQLNKEIARQLSDSAMSAGETIEPVLESAKLADEQSRVLPPSVDQVQKRSRTIRKQEKESQREN